MASSQLCAVTVNATATWFVETPTRYAVAHRERLYSRVIAEGDHTAGRLEMELGLAMGRHA